MIVDHKHKYVFIAVPKTASISIQFSLGYGHDVPEPPFYHRKLADVVREHSCDGYFKFGFVRNPWDRLYSLYHDFTTKRVKQYSALVKHDSPLLSEFSDFNDMCVKLKDSPWKDDLFFQPQYDYLNVNGELAAFGRFENLKEDFERICRTIGLEDVNLLHMNQGQCAPTYAQHYTPESIEAVRTLYAKDVEAFGYEF